VVSPSKRPLLDNNKQSQEKDIYVSGEIRICNPSNRAAADPRLTSRGHWDRLFKHKAAIKFRDSKFRQYK